MQRVANASLILYKEIHRLCIRPPTMNPLKISSAGGAKQIAYAI